MVSFDFVRNQILLIVCRIKSTQFLRVVLSMIAFLLIGFLIGWYFLVERRKFSFEIQEFNSWVPRRYTCDGGNYIPSGIRISNVPKGTVSIAWIMEDYDAIPVTGTIYTHNVVYNMLPDGSRGINGLNENNKAAYLGPCPPRGTTHVYDIVAYALDEMLTFHTPPTKDALRKAMTGHILATSIRRVKYTRE
jgi:Raf kinase inhibitor-like YbhB/YbcL family protein